MLYFKMMAQPFLMFNFNILVLILQAPHQKYMAKYDFAGRVSEIQR